MQRDPLKFLYDIREACRLVSAFTEKRTLDDYRKDPLLKSAVERQFQVIGEAMRQMVVHAPEKAARITDYQRIISFRHILVHGYDVVDDEVVWGIVEKQLPALIKDVNALLAGG